MREREQTIAFDMNYCQHYTPETIFGIGGKKATGICAAGVKVADVRLPKCSKPCLGGHELDDAKTVCPSWIRRTREQGEARADAFDAAIKRMEMAGPIVTAWRTWSKTNRVSKQEIIDCPTGCGGKLHLSQAAYNGHVHGKCTTNGCLSWME